MSQLRESEILIRGGKKMGKVKNNNELDRKELTKEFKGMSPKELLKEWLKSKKKSEETVLRSSILRERMIEEVTKKYPDEKRSARIEVNGYYIIRSAVPKIKWDNNKFKKLVGEELYGQVIDIEETINENKVEKLKNEGKIKMGDVEKSSEVDFITQLRVNLRSEDKPEESELRPLVEDMCR